MKRQVRKMAGGMMNNKRMRGMKSEAKNPLQTFTRLMKYVLKNYGGLYGIVVVLIVVGVLANVQGTMFTKNLIDDYITPMLTAETPDFGPLAAAIGRVAIFYAIGILSVYTYNRIMVNITHNIDDAAKRYGQEGNYVMGANIAGFEKVVDAMMAQGIV